MKHVSVLLALSLLSGSVFAAKDCEVLKSEIAAKLDTKGVQNYRLDIVSPEDVSDQHVVGSCGGGSKRIVYTRHVAQREQ